MTEEEFQAWKHSPATEPFLRFLHQVREDLKERWAKGDSTLVLGGPEHAIAMVYGDILELTWPKVAEFYGVDVREQEEDDNEQE